MSFAIHVENLSKLYHVQHGHRYAQQRTLREEAARALGAPRRWWRGATVPSQSEELWALHGVSFEVQPGETIGILGRNGAGKSTLLKILSRVVTPTTGFARLRGRVGGLLEVASGFHPELTGQENIFLSGALLGMQPEEIERKFEVIAAFAGLGGFLDTAVKHYSSGMNVRLAFSVAAHLEPDILLLDEVLAVGDADFQQRSAAKVEEITRVEGRTVVLVGHQLSIIERLCSRCLLLDHGRLIVDGAPTDVIAHYHAMLAQTDPGAAAEA